MSVSVYPVGEISALITDLTRGRGPTRRRARESLVFIGKPAVASLTAVLTNPNEHVRWEAIKALEGIGGSEAARVLVEAVENDQDSSIRWLAAEALIGLGRAGLVPLLQALVRHSGSVWLREGAHYVMRRLNIKYPDLGSQLTPVLAALESRESVAQVSPAAQAILDALTETVEGVAAGEGLQDDEQAAQVGAK